MLGKWYGFILLLLILLAGCDDKPLNHPYPSENDETRVFYSHFTGRPKTLDPARSYSVDEALFTGQIYEPPLQYHYLKRPYLLTPLTAARMPVITYLNAKGDPLPKDADETQIAYSMYEITLQPGIQYQPHPGFAKDHQGQYRYHTLSKKEAATQQALVDFDETDSRELTADDYVYQIKRLAHPATQSPIFGFMENHIIGFTEYQQLLQQAYEENTNHFFDLRKYDFPGVEVVDRYTYRIYLKGKYPQFIYWLAMHFFAPIPWEVDYFYSQSGMEQHNLGFDWYPVGTGPYLLSENNPNRRMTLQKNPNFRGEYYPQEGELEDESKGLLTLSGTLLPIVDKFVFTLEREAIPRWNKFLQGYYDQSGIATDSFDEAIQIDALGKPELTSSIAEKSITLKTSIDPSVYYLGFNMLDPVVGGASERARKLRLAIAVALDFEEYISIFLNGRAVVANGLVPPGVFGYRSGKGGMNQKIYEFKNNKIKRRSLAYAKRLLLEAGYANGIDPKTQQPLILNYDAIGGAQANERAQFNWMRKQFAKLGIELYVKSTHYNRFREKIRTGNSQIYMWGWSADYPDPENFLFLLYGPNGKVSHGGENTSNYHNAEFDSLFKKMKGMDNTSERQVIIDKMREIIQGDSPLVFAYHPKSFTLYHQWVSPRKFSGIINNGLKYVDIDMEKRQSQRKQWNQSNFWPLLFLLGIFVAVLIPVVYRFWRKEHFPMDRID